MVSDTGGSAWKLLIDRRPLRSALAPRTLIVSLCWLTDFEVRLQKKCAVQVNRLSLAPMCRAPLCGSCAIFGEDDHRRNKARLNFVINIRDNLIEIRRLKALN